MGLNLESRITLNSAGFERGMSRVKDTLSESVKSFVLGAIGVGTVEEAFRRTIETASELVNTAKRLNSTVEQVQLLKQAAKDAGGELDTVAAAIEKINQARAHALGGGAEGLKAGAAFQALGVSRQDLDSKTAADLLMHEIGDKVKSTNVEQIAGPLREVLGRGAGESIAFLKTDFNELEKKMRESGAIMSGEVAAKLKALGDEFDLVSRILVAQLAPALLAFAEWAYRIVLKGGGAVAGLAATAGAMTGGQNGVTGAIKSTAEIAMSMAKGPMTQQQITDILAKNGINRADVQARTKDAESPWAKAADDLKATMDRATKGILNPKPDFNKTAMTAEAMRGGGRMQTDSLLKVGNFLGTNIGAIQGGAGKMEQHAANTARHTERTAFFTKLTADQIGQVLSGRGPVRDIMNMTQQGRNLMWPNNGG